MNRSYPIIPPDALGPPFTPGGVGGARRRSVAWHSHVSWRPASLALCLLAGLGCKHEVAHEVLPVVEAIQRDLTVRVQSTGVVEPIDTIQVKSKASGLVLKMPVEVGTEVKQGDLLAQIDPRDVTNQYNSALADDVATMAGLSNAALAKARSDSMFGSRVITVTEHDSVRAQYVKAAAGVADKRAGLDLARQQLEDATIRAPTSGTILSKPVSQGQLITSATSVYGGGTSLVTMADLGRVRLRVSVDEADMANVRVGEQATVLVDAFPGRTFDGVVEKIEPQAVVNQGVTFFPVLVSISNRDHSLMPGMNGEVNILSAQRSHVLTIPTDAVRGANELAAVARLFGIPVDSLRGELRTDLVPAAASQGGGGHFVVVALPDGAYELRAVQLAARNLDWAEVVDGVKQGEKVVPLEEAALHRPTLTPTLRLAASIKRSARSPSGA